MITVRRRRIAVITGVLLFSIAVAIISLPSIPQASSQAPASFVFGAAGDLGANSATAASLTALAGAGTNFFVTLGDLSYDQVTPESAWCDYVKQRVGTSYPFELHVGNHEWKTSGPDGFIDTYAGCLPDRLGASGRYAHQYYIDYPPGAPLMRLILIDPALYRDDVMQKYCTSGDTTNCNWLKARIDEAKAQGLWTVVGTHKVCITMGSLSCEIGANLLNVLINRKVDLVLQGHDHGYQRSKQLALGTGCTAVVANAYNAGCVVDDGADGVYTKGAGTVIAIPANFGLASNTMNTTDPEAPYFAAWMNRSLKSYGFLKFTVTASRIDAQYVHGQGTYTDQFSIVGTAARMATAAPTETPAEIPAVVGGSHVYTYTSAADSYVMAAHPDTNFGQSLNLKADGAPVARSYLRFDLQGLNDPVVKAQLLLHTASGSSTGFQVNAVDDNTWTENSITYANAPAPGALVANSGPFAIGTWKAVDVTALVHGNGAVNLALTSINPTGMVFGGNQGVDAPMLVITTLKDGTPRQGFTPDQPAQASTVDTDGDGLSDADEVLNGTDIHKPDTDGDGLPDLWEVEVGLDPRIGAGATGAVGDPDDDELNNLQEFAQKTDPWEVDTLGETLGGERMYLPFVDR
jgi:hypothetical protein